MKKILMLLVLAICFAGGLFTQTASAQYSFEVRVYTDKAWLNYYGNDPALALFKAEQQMDAAKAVFSSDLNISLRIYYSTWDTNTTDPYMVAGQGIASNLNHFQAWVAANKPNGIAKNQDVSVIFSGLYFGESLAGTSGACYDDGIAVIGRHPTYVVNGFEAAHEIAHTLTATHTTIADGTDTPFKIMDIDNYGNESVLSFAQFSRNQIAATLPYRFCIIHF